MSQPKEFGIALSGGGIRGIAHAGVLKALEEQGIEPTQISGSSAGAMVGALYAAGYKAEDIKEFFKMNTNVFRWKNFARNKPGFLNTEGYVEMFNPWLNDQTFESLPKQLHICVTDVLNGKIRFFSTGELVRPILASMAVPGVFTPVEINDCWYIDGGTMNNFPIEPLVGRCDVLLGSFVSQKRAFKKEELSNTLKLINRANDLAFLSGSIHKFSLCDFVFAPEELWNYGLFDNKKVDEIFKIGYEYGSRKIEDLLKILDQEKDQHEGGKHSNDSAPGGVSK